MNTVKSKISLLGLLGTASLLAVPARAQLIAIDPAAGRAAGINASGTVILDTHLYSAGVLTSLGIGQFGIAGSVGPAPMNEGAAINDAGETVGQISIHGAFRDAAGNITDIGVMPGVIGINTTASFAKGMNNLSQVVGSGARGGKIYGFYRPAGGSLTYLPAAPVGNGSPVFPGTTVSEAFDINDAGQIVGFFGRDLATLEVGLIRVAFILDSVNNTWTEIGRGAGYAVNANGSATGLLETANSNPECGRAFLHISGSTQNLGTLGGACSTGLALNVNNIVVGSSRFADGTATHAFLFNGAMQDLNDLIAANDPLKATVTLTEARGINDSGLVVANGFDSANPSQVRAYLLQAPTVILTGGELDFGGVASGSVSTAQVTTMTNNGAAGINIGAVTTRGDFQQTNDCPAILAPGAACSFSIRFAPASAGNHRGGVTVMVNDVPVKTLAFGYTPFDVILNASTASTFVGAGFSLSWTSTAGATCTGLSSTLTGQAAVDWGQTKAASGSQTLTVTAPGTYRMTLRCEANSRQGTSAEVTVEAIWPEVAITLTPSASSVVSGNAVTFTWSTQHADACVASGGGANDTWPGNRPANGSVSVVEPSAVSVPTNLTFTLTCSSSVSGKTAITSAVVTLNPAPPPREGGGGGGGSLDALWLMMLAGAIAMRGRQPGARGPGSRH